MEKNYILAHGEYPSADGRSTVAYYCFVPARKRPHAIVQICHGMREYVMRYEPLADYLSGLGYVVCGNDHTGHGKTAADADDFGFTGGANVMVEDVSALSWRMRDEYPGLPLVLLGHSMGSFVARLYATRYPGQADGLVIVGTGGPDNPTGMGKLLARLTAKLRGERYRSKLITQIAFGSYNKRVPREKGKTRSPSSWLSRDEAVVKAYDEDEYCSYIFTAKGYYDLFDLIGRVSQREWAYRLPRTLPVLLLSGEEDPVGGYGRGVKKVYERLLDAHMTDVRMLLYAGARHEVFNETNRESVFRDLSQWLSEHNF